jgi:outer membrane translocation and assembly module TamA
MNLAVWIALSVLMETEEGRAIRLKAEEYAKEKELRKLANQNKVHIGTAGQKVEMKLKVTHTSRYENAYGTGTRVSFEDENGNNLVWFSTNALDTQSCEDNKFYQWKFTIKGHGEFKDVKQTIITRAKLLHVDKFVDDVENSPRQQK